MIRAVIALAAPLALLGGCAVGPKYAAPRTPASAAGPLIEGSRATTAAAPTATWWRLYRDPVLDGLITDAFAANTDLRVAIANIARARGALRTARSDRLPSTNLSAQYSYSQPSIATGGSGSGSSGSTGTGGTGGGTGGTSGSGTGGGRQQFSVFDVGFDAAYEVDLFGRVSRSIEASRRDVEAAEANRDDVRVVVAADAASAYADACSGTEQIAVARRTLALLDRSLGLTQLQYREGRGNNLDVSRAIALREQQAATIPQLEAARSAALYALAALTGRAPAELPETARRCTRAPQLDLPIPIGDGAALLARRPDVRAAERTLAADTARIGVATSELYPNIRLGGSAGFTSSALRTLFTGNAFNWAVNSLITWAFPNQEAARGRILSSRGQAAASLARFDGTVLNALRDTETALNALARELDRAQALDRAATAARQAATLSRLRFAEGRDDFLSQLDAERTLAGAENALAASRGQIAARQIRVFRELGGGWEGFGPDPGERSPIFDGSQLPPRDRVQREQLPGRR